MSGFAIGPLLGPIIGPVAGGYLSNALGWRWVFWIISICSGVVTILVMIFARETYAPIILQKKVNKLRKETGNNLLCSKLDHGMPPKVFFKRSIVRPCKMLLFSPICAVGSLYVGIAYAYLYLMFGSMTPLFMKIYGFGPGEAGLAFLGLGVGSMAGVLGFSVMSDRYIKKKAEEERVAAEAEGRPAEGMKPEYRLPPLRVGALLLPVGLFVYGWTADYEVHWIAPIIGTAVVGVAQLLIFMVRVPLPGIMLFQIQLTTYSRSRCTSWMPFPFTVPQPLRPMPSCGPSLVLPFPWRHFPCSTSWVWAGATVFLVSLHAS